MRISYSSLENQQVSLRRRWADYSQKVTASLEIKKQKGHLLVLDGVRAVACLAVLLHHIVYQIVLPAHWSGLWKPSGKIQVIFAALLSFGNPQGIPSVMAKSVIDKEPRKLDENQKPDKKKNVMLKSVIDVFRPLRWYRNGFMLAAVILAIKILNIPLSSVVSFSFIYPVLIAFAGLCFVASGNYGINEVCDLETDKHHPEKKNRSIPSGRISPATVIYLSILLYVIGFFLVSSLNNYMLFISLSLLLISGILYNIKPFRLKDKPYLDFIFEAANNPIRLMVGWYAVAKPYNLVPASIVLGFWFLGIFLMAAKRFGEIRFIQNQEEAAKYRKSFKYYNEENLLFSMIAAAVSFSFMLGALSLKYSVDLIVALPFTVIWMIWFFHLAYQKNTIVKDPERIFEKKTFLLFSLLTLLVFMYFFFSGNQIFAWFLRK
jgi:decaprenyl-phosphate phosphoribosyltransferase